MKNSHVVLTLALITTLAVAFFPVGTEAQPPLIYLDASLVDCSGPTATFDLVATTSLSGGWFEWGSGVTRISPSDHNNPNFATISFVTIARKVGVNYARPDGGLVRAAAWLTNPCVEP